VTVCLLERSRRNMLSTEHLGLAWGTVRPGRSHRCWRRVL